VKFGTKSKDVPVYSGSDYIRNLKKGETTLRFLQECEDWVMYREHYSLDGKSFPCTNDRATCPGCTDPNERVSRSSRKYAANVLIKPNDMHVVIKMPVTVVNKFEARSERNDGTITNRDYVIFKSGEGLDTEYDVENGDKYEVDKSPYKLFDVEEMLVDAFESANGVSVDDQSPKVQAEDDIPPSKPQSQSASEDAEEEVVITEEQLRKMDLFELAQVFKQANLELPKDIESADQLVDYILTELAS
jgi:hypothetical protein